MKDEDIRSFMCLSRTIWNIAEEMRAFDKYWMLQDLMSTALGLAEDIVPKEYKGRLYKFRMDFNDLIKECKNKEQE